MSLSQARSSSRSGRVFRSGCRAFFCLRPPARVWVRALLTALLALFFFRMLCRPMIIRGVSMEPAFADGSIRFYWRPAYRRRTPRRGEVVAVRLAGERVMLLKRVVGRTGETVAFEDGRLLINDRPVEEPWAAGPSDWNLPPRTVLPGHVYVVGDNRSMPIDRHALGQVAVDRLAGRALW